MKRFIVFISLHLFLFLLIIAYQAQANQDDWNVITSDEFIVTTKPGEVIWGDKLSLIIKKNDCARMNIVFSFSTKKENENIKNLQNKLIPIKINGHEEDLEVEVIMVQPMFNYMNLVLMQAPGLKNIEKMIGSMMAWYNHDNFFGIELVNSSNFDPKEYFDILNNNWKLDGLPEKITEAQSICYGPDETEVG